MGWVPVVVFEELMCLPAQRDHLGVVSLVSGAVFEKSQIELNKIS